MPDIVVNGVKLFYEDKGQGKPIVFLHGYVGDIEDWRAQINYFSPKYRCLALDQRGRGKGEAPKTKEEYSFTLFVDDVYKWVRKLKVEKFVLVGHSLGGMIAQGFVLAHPEMVEALVLTDTSSGSMSVRADNPDQHKRLNEIALTLGTVAAFDYDLVNNPATKARYMKHPETFDRMREKTRTTSAEGYVFVREAGQDRPVFTERLSEIKCPTLLFCGTDDTGLVVRYNDALAKFLEKIKY
jgi:3-oxoadipate enol-lactonase